MRPTADLREGVPALTPIPGGEGIARCVAEVRRDLDASVAQSPAAALLHPYFARGKLLRATLVLASASASGGNPSAAVRGAVAVELLHGASLIHDDIADRAATRRGLAALHESLGDGQALVAGDDLLFAAIAALADGAEPAFPPGGRESLQLLMRRARECCRGQYRELEAGMWVSVETYLAIVAGKTGAPLVAACELGALLGGGGTEYLPPLRAYAGALGVAYQIGDDLLDVLGDEEVMGKPVGNSLSRGHPTLPMLLLWRRCTDAEREFLSRCAAAPARLDELAALLRRHSVVPAVMSERAHHTAAACAALSALPPSPGRELLRSLALDAAPPLASATLLRSGAQ